MAGTLGFATAALDALGVRLIAPDRPGLGRSDPDPVKSLARHGDDVAALLDHLGAAAARAVGFSQGAPFALALGGAGVVEAVAVVAGQDDLGHPAVFARLPDDLRAMVTAARHDPAGLANAVAAVASAAWLWEMVLGFSLPQDRAFFSAPPFATAYRECLAAGFAQGPAGYAADLAAGLGVWPVAAEAIAVPVDLWYGEHDASAVHSPDQGATLAARLPDARRTVVPGAGAALPWTHGATILAALLARRPGEGRPPAATGA
jgi:pimeloyl-ACP methyl ester carboxylesterase